MHTRPVERVAATLVWIDAQEAIIVRWGDRATVERVGAADAGTGRPEPLAAFLEAVATRLPDADDVTVVGPGHVRERLERGLRADDRLLGRRRRVRTGSAERRTEQALVAHVRELAGEPNAAPGKPVGGGDGVHRLPRQTRADRPART